MNILDKRLNEVEEQLKNLNISASLNLSDIKFNFTELCQNNQIKHQQIQILEQQNANQEKLIARLVGQNKNYDIRIKELESFFANIQLQSEKNQQNLKQDLATALAEKESLEKEMSEQASRFQGKLESRKEKYEKATNENAALLKQFESIKNQLKSEKKVISKQKEELEQQIQEQRQQNQLIIANLKIELDQTKQDLVRTQEFLKKELQKQKEECQKSQIQNQELFIEKEDLQQKIKIQGQHLKKKKTKIVEIKKYFEGRIDELKSKLDQTELQLQSEEKAHSQTKNNLLKDQSKEMAECKIQNNKLSQQIKNLQQEKEEILNTLNLKIQKKKNKLKSIQNQLKLEQDEREKVKSIFQSKLLMKKQKKQKLKENLESLIQSEKQAHEITKNMLEAQDNKDGSKQNEIKQILQNEINGLNKKCEDFQKQVIELQQKLLVSGQEKQKLQMEVQKLQMEVQKCLQEIGIMKPLLENSSNNEKQKENLLTTADKKIQTLEAQISSLKLELEKNKSFEQRFLKSEEEVQKLQSKLEENVKSQESQKLQINQETQNFQAKNAILIEENQQKEEVIKIIKEEIKKLQEDVVSYQKIQQSCKCEEYKLQIQKLKQSINLKQINISSQDLSTYQQTQQPYTTREQLEEESSEEEDFETQKQNALKQNVLLQNVQGISGEKPMSYINVFKFFEQTMDSKYKQDQEDLSSGIKPRSLPNYLYDQLIQQYGIKQLALKSLQQLLLALKQLYDEGHQYGILFCRFLQIHHKDPIDLILATFLIKVRFDFNKLLDIYSKRIAQAQSKKPTSQQSFGKMKYEQDSIGGEVPLIDLFVLINTLFVKDLQFGIALQNKLFPTNNREQFLIYIIVWKMARLGKTPAQIYEILDANRQGSISFDTILKGLQYELSIFLSQEEVEVLKQNLIIKQNGDVESKDFVSGLTKLSRQKIDKDQWLTSKSSFLTAIADVYDEKMYQDIEAINSLFRTFEIDINQSIDYERFLKVTTSLDSSLTEETLRPIFEESTLKTKQNKINQKQFLHISQKYAIGQFGIKIFGIFSYYRGLKNSVMY